MTIIVNLSSIFLLLGLEDLKFAFRNAVGILYSWSYTEIGKRHTGLRSEIWLLSPNSTTHPRVTSGLSPDHSEPDIECGMS